MGAISPAPPTVDLTRPGPIGSNVPGSGAFTTLGFTGGAFDQVMSSFGSLEARLTGNTTGNVLALRNSQAVGGFAAIACQTRAGVEHGAFGMNSDGTEVYVEASDASGIAVPRINFYMTFGGDPSKNHSAFIHDVNGTEMYTVTCNVTPPIAILDAGLVRLWPQAGFGVEISDPRPTGGHSSVRMIDAGVEKLALGHFTGTNIHHLTYTGTLNFFAATSSSMDQDGHFIAGGKVSAKFFVLRPGDMPDNNSISCDGTHIYYTDGSGVPHQLD